MPVANTTEPAKQVDPKEFPAIHELRKHAKLNGPALIDRVYTEFMRLHTAHHAQPQTVAPVAATGEDLL